MANKNRARKRARKPIPPLCRQSSRRLKLRDGNHNDFMNFRLQGCGRGYGADAVGSWMQHSLWGNMKSQSLHFDAGPPSAMLGTFSYATATGHKNHPGSFGGVSLAGLSRQKRCQKSTMNGHECSALLFADEDTHCIANRAGHVPRTGKHIIIRN